MRWVTEVNYLIRLSNAEVSATYHFNKKRASKALRHFSEVTQATIFERQKLAQTKAYAEKKLKVKIYMQLFDYKEERINQRHRKIHA